MNYQNYYQNPQQTPPQEYSGGRENQEQQVILLKKEGGFLKDNIFMQHGRFFAERHWNELKFTLLGLLIAILFLGVGFWATILLILLGAIGNIYGRYRDGDVRPLIFLERFFHRF